MFWVEKRFDWKLPKAEHSTMIIVMTGALSKLWCSSIRQTALVLITQRQTWNCVAQKFSITPAIHSSPVPIFRAIAPRLGALLKTRSTFPRSDRGIHEYNQTGIVGRVRTFVPFGILNGGT